MPLSIGPPEILALDLAAACGSDEYCRQAMAGERKPNAVVDLLRRGGTGPLWGMASSDLNATLLVWPAGRELAEDTNTELDVLLVVLEGGGVAVVEHQEHVLVPGNLLLIEKGRSRAIRAGQDGLRYPSIHIRPGPLQIAGPSRPR
jgi:mannose-6-phosphate isomerase-like protein (cupin superfamily)